MTFQDIVSCPHNLKHLKIIQRVFWGERKNAQSPVRAKFRCRAITHTVCTV